MCILFQFESHYIRAFVHLCKLIQIASKCFRSEAFFSLRFKPVGLIDLADWHEIHTPSLDSAPMRCIVCIVGSMSCYITYVYTRDFLSLSKLFLLFFLALSNLSALSLNLSSKNCIMLWINPVEWLHLSTQHETFGGRNNFLLHNESHQMRCSILKLRVLLTFVSCKMLDALSLLKYF